MSGLMQMRHPGQKPTIITPKLQAVFWMRHGASPRMVRRTGRCGNWRELNIRKDTVHRVRRPSFLRLLSRSSSEARFKNISSDKP